jgi:hypothetical protein
MSYRNYYMNKGILWTQHYLIFFLLLLWIWPDNEVIELVSGMPVSEVSGTDHRECEDQSHFKVQAVPVFRLM